MAEIGAEVTPNILYGPEHVEPGQTATIEYLCTEEWEIAALEVPLGFAVRKVHAGDRLIVDTPESLDYRQEFCGPLRLIPGDVLVVVAERLGTGFRNEHMYVRLNPQLQDVENERFTYTRQGRTYEHGGTPRLCPGCRILDGEHDFGETCTLREAPDREYTAVDLAEISADGLHLLRSAAEAVRAAGGGRRTWIEATDRAWPWRIDDDEPDERLGELALRIVDRLKRAETDRGRVAIVYGELITEFGGQK